ncbi:MAG: type II toxin-antitoxin system HicB family antitoxin [Oscillospiraceae bacterium]|nr:type II toxin-antitoxin system HicB family antitoxin [Oscillospiraceae bacterium]
MKNSYPVVLSPDKVGYMVFVPDFNINTEGDSLTEAIEMARDAIGLMGIDMEDDKKTIPSPSAVDSIITEGAGDVVTLVDVDFTEYRRKHDLRTVRRNVSIPSWLDFEAERSGVNVSAILQKALKQELHLSDR